MKEISAGFGIRGRRLRGKRNPCSFLAQPGYKFVVRCVATPIPSTGVFSARLQKAAPLVWREPVVVGPGKKMRAGLRHADSGHL